MDFVAVVLLLLFTFLLFNTITRILSLFAIERFSFEPLKLITGGKLKQIANENIRT